MNGNDDQRAERRVGSGFAPWDESLDDYWPEEIAESTSESSDPHPEFAVGTIVTDFATVDVTVRKRGEGAMGLVLCGPSARRAGNWIALKVLLPEHFQEQAFRDAYEREAITWCHVWPHRCIVTANGLTRLPTHARQPALILTYASGGTLREQLESAHVVGDRPIPLARAFAWAQHIASALVAIHAPDPGHERPQPLVHADIKPENILIDGDAIAQVTDLSLARAWAAEASLTGESGAVRSPEHSGAQEAPSAPETRITHRNDDAGGTIPPFHSRRLPVDPGIPRMGSQGPVFGTMTYMPPEQWLGEDAVVPATDVYALGIILFELFAGLAQRPHLIELTGEGTIAQAIYASHVRGPRLHLTDSSARALTDGPLSALSHSGEPDAEARAGAVLRGLDALIERCLAPDHQDRPSSSDLLTLLGDLAEQAGLAREVGAERMPITLATEATFWNDLANTYGHVGRHDEQERLARRAVELAPDDPELWANLASALSMSKQREKALEVYREAEAHLPRPNESDMLEVDQWRARMAILLYNWATAYYEQGLYREAVATYKRSLDLDPTSAAGRYALAASYVALADEAATVGDRTAQLLNLREADAALIRTLAFYPDFPEAQHALQRVQAARETIERAIEGQQVDPKSP